MNVDGICTDANIPFSLAKSVIALLYFNKSSNILSVKGTPGSAN